jgi:hypothetical protein
MVLTNVVLAQLCGGIGIDVWRDRFAVLGMRNAEHGDVADTLQPAQAHFAGRRCARRSRRRGACAPARPGSRPCSVLVRLRRSRARRT